MHIKEIESRSGTPVAQKARLHIVQGERMLQQRIVFQIDLADGKVVGGPPIGVHFV